MTNKTKPAVPTAAVIIIGNEILSGRTQDVNLNVIAKQMHDIGVKLIEARVVPDIEEEIIAAVNALRSRATYVFTTGGIGPTHDDITAASIAKAFGVPLVENPEARATLETYYMSDNLNAARLRMASVPQGAKLIANPISAAPGFQIENVYVMAGVPSVMEIMLASVVKGLQPGPRLHVVTIICAVPEGLLADSLTDVAVRYAELDIGSYPAFQQGKISTSLVLRGTDKTTVATAARAIREIIVRLGGSPVVMWQSGESYSFGGV
jgi:molybdenum cofactor synthesis domain-containing protein